VSEELHQLADDLSALSRAEERRLDLQPADADLADLARRAAGLDQAAGFLGDDSAGVREMLDAVAGLADEPRPAGSFPYGHPRRPVRRADGEEDVPPGLLELVGDLHSLPRAPARSAGTIATSSA